jgi:hypothetical protein
VILSGLAFLVGWLVLASAAGFPLYVLLAEPEPSDDKLDALEFVFLGLFLGTLSIGWLALTLLQAGQFTPWRVIVLAVGLPIGAIGIALQRRRRLVLPALRVTWFTRLALVLCVGALALFVHPAEFVFGGADAGVYVSLGALWAKSGSFQYEEPGLAQVPVDAWSSLFRQSLPGRPHDYFRLPGFYMHSVDPGVVIPQFFPLHPVWFALVHGILGLEASLFTTPLWAVMGLLAVVLLTRRLLGTPAGVLAGVFLLLTPLQIYFARYPTAEALTQFLLWGGLFALAMFAKEGRRFWGIVSGVALGQVFLVRIDMLPLLIVPGTWLLMSLIRGSWRRDRWFLVAFGALLLQSVYQSLVLSWPYTWDIYHHLGNYAWRLLRQGGWLIPVSLGLGAAIYVLLARRGALLTAHTASLAKKGLAVLLLGLAIFAYFIWPLVGETKLSAYWYGGQPIPIQNHLNLVKLGWYLSPLGIALGIAGIIWIILRENWQRVWPLVVVGLSFTTLYIYDILNNPYHIYAMRRYVPVVVPFFAIGMAYTIVRLWSLPDRGRRSRYAAGLVACALVGWLLYNSRSVWNLVEYRGLTSQVRTLAGNLEPGAVLLFDDEPSVGAGATVGTPLQYLFGFTAFDLQEAFLQEDSLRHLVADWHGEGRTVYWVVGPRPVLELPSWLALEPALGAWLRSEQLEASYYEFPEQRVHTTVPLEFYRVVPDSAESGCGLPVLIDIGSLDTVYVVNGFYSKELLDSRSIRWTDGVGTLRLPCELDGAAGPHLLSLRAAAIRGVGMAPVNVTVSLNEQQLGQFVLGPEFEELHLPFSGSFSGDGVMLAIESDTWVPMEAGVGSDPRTLGIVIDSVRISIGAGSE